MVYKRQKKLSEFNYLIGGMMYETRSHKKCNE